MKSNKHLKVNLVFRVLSAGFFFSLLGCMADSEDVGVREDLNSNESVSSAANTSPTSDASLDSANSNMQDKSHTVVVGVQGVSIYASSEFFESIDSLDPGDELTILDVVADNVKVKTSEGEIGWVRRCWLCGEQEYTRRESAGHVPQNIVCIKAEGDQRMVYGGNMRIQNGEPTIGEGDSFWLDDSMEGIEFSLGSNLVIGNPSELLLFINNRIVSLPIYDGAQAPKSNEESVSVHDWRESFPQFIDEVSSIVGEDPHWPVMKPLGVLEALDADGNVIYLIPTPSEELPEVSKIQSTFEGQDVKWEFKVSSVKDGELGLETIESYPFTPPLKGIYAISAKLADPSQSGALTVGQNVVISGTIGSNLFENIYLIFGVGPNMGDIVLGVGLIDAVVLND